MDLAYIKSYRLISNLLVISKLLELGVSKKLVKYLKDNNMLPDRQSAYRVNHSMETTVIKVIIIIIITTIGCHAHIIRQFD